MVRRLVGFAMALAVSLGCSEATGTVSTHALVDKLPMDSIVASLGVDTRTRGLMIAGGHNDEPTAGRFEHTYTIEFAAQPPGGHTLSLLADKVRAAAIARGAPVNSRSSAGETSESMTYATSFVRGSIVVAVAKPSSAELDRYVVVMSETHRLTR
ncbi:MAG TPA: hypothetical protein VM076_18850 [Gemmatimonadaceae bacterium]|nr:hypothetical protein [Gemmatimonadaceae bacterium]